MQVNNSQFQYIFSIYKDENKTEEMKKEIYEARKEDATLDRALYAMDLAELYKDLAKSKQIANKIAKGESVTEEEKKYLAENDAEMLRKAESAKQKAEQLKEKMRNANSKNEAQSIAMSAVSEATVSIEGGDEQYGQLLMEAIKEEIKDFNNIDNKEISKYNSKAYEKSKYLDINY